MNVIAPTSVKVQVVGVLVFACDPDDGTYPDVAGAMAALEKAGYGATRYPQEFKHLLIAAGDDFVEAARAVDGIVADPDDTDLRKLNSESGSGSPAVKVKDAAWIELEDLVSGYGGWLEQLGFEEVEGYVPFKYLKLEA